MAEAVSRTESESFRQIFDYGHGQAGSVGFALTLLLLLLLLLLLQG